jgi:hypothetical protein
LLSRHKGRLHLHDASPQVNQKYCLLQIGFRAEADPLAFWSVFRNSFEKQLVQANPCKFPFFVRPLIEIVHMQTEKQSIFRASALKHHLAAQSQNVAPKLDCGRLLLWLWAALGLLCAGGLIVGLYLTQLLGHA